MISEARAVCAHAMWGTVKCEDAVCACVRPCGMWVCVMFVCRGLWNVFTWGTRYFRKLPVVRFLVFCLFLPVVKH